MSKSNDADKSLRIDFSMGFSLFYGDVFIIAPAFAGKWPKQLFSL
jgi:hypothetical protein